MAKKIAQDPAAIDMQALSQYPSHVLFTITPNDDDRSDFTLRVTSPYLCGLVVKEIAELEVAAQVSFYHKASTLPHFRGTWGYMFEIYFLAWLYSTEQAEALPCTAKSATSATAAQPSTPSTSARLVKTRKSDRIEQSKLKSEKKLKAENKLKARNKSKAENKSKLRLQPLGRDKVTVFSGDSSFTKVNDFATPFGFLPASRTFPFFDAVIFTDKNIITIQLTVSSTHTMKPDGFELLKQYLPAKFEKTRTRCHVFVTDRDANATSMRKQNHEVAVEKNISIYTAILDVPACNFSPEGMERIFTPSVCWYNPLYIDFGTHLGVIRMSLLRWTPVGWR